MVMEVARAMLARPPPAVAECRPTGIRAARRRTGLVGRGAALLCMLLYVGSVSMAACLPASLISLM